MPLLVGVRRWLQVVHVGQGGTQDYFSPANSVHVLAGDHDAMSAALLHLLVNTTARGLLGSAGRRYAVRHYSPRYRAEQTAAQLR